MKCFMWVLPNEQIPGLFYGPYMAFKFSNCDAYDCRLKFLNMLVTIGSLCSPATTAWYNVA